VMGCQRANCCSNLTARTSKEHWCGYALLQLMSMYETCRIHGLLPDEYHELE